MSTIIFKYFVGFVPVSKTDVSGMNSGLGELSQAHR